MALTSALASETVTISANDLDTLYGCATAFLATMEESEKGRALGTLIALIGGVTPEVATEAFNRLEPIVHANIAAGYVRRK